MSEIVLQFGKHKGKTVAAVADTNPSYLCWLCDHLPDLEDKLYSEIQAALQRSGHDPNDPRDFPPCPDPKGGVHFWIMSAGGWCKGHDIPQKKAADMIRENISRDPNPANEIEAALEKIYSESAPAPGQLIVRKSKAPVVDHAWRREVVAQNSLSLCELIVSSPLCLDSDPDAAEKVIDAIFPGNPLICVGKAANLFATRPRETWRGHLSRLAFIVPNPMKSREGMAQAGHKSERCLDNVGLRRFIVAEQDSGSPEEQIAVLRYLARFLPLVMIVHSGNRSCHGWYFVEGLPEERINQFMDIACRLGADNVTRCRAQLVRLPGGTRDDGSQQRIFYFNPRKLAAHTESKEGTSQPDPRQPKAGDRNNPRDIPSGESRQDAPGNSPDTSTETESEEPFRDIQSIPHLPLPPGLPPEVTAILSTAPPFGQGLLQWIRPACLSLLRGRHPAEVAGFLHLVLRHYPLTAKELLVLKNRQ
jgi:hypothetical protein